MVVAVKYWTFHEAHFKPLPKILSYAKIYSYLAGEPEILLQLNFKTFLIAYYKISCALGLVYIITGNST